MEFEWDAIKDQSNLDKHGIDFESAIGIWDGRVLERIDDRKDYGEERIIAFGAVERVVLAVVYTWRQDRRRIISARKARDDERRGYYQALARGCPPRSH